MSIYTAYDMGWIDHDKSQVFERGHLQGASLGVRANNGYMFFDLGYEVPINASSFIRDKSDIFRVKLGVNI